MEFNVTLKAQDGRMVAMAAQQANAIQEMNNTRKAGIASVTGYQPTTNWDITPTQDIQLITHISIPNLYKRRLEALNAIEFKDVAEFLAGHDSFGGKSMRELLDIFNERKLKEVTSLEKSLGGTLQNAHTEGHERCYAHFGNVKVHLITEKVDGLKQPVLDDDGNVQLQSIMVQYIELNVKTIKEGKRKVVKSGAPVMMSKLIQKALNKKSTVLKTLSLKADNFESFKIDGKELVTEDVAKFGDIIQA